VVDFGVLPPEVNSGLMYAGAGSGPMVAAAAAWDGLAAELSSAATSYRAVVSELTGQSWLGPSSAMMAASAAPYVAWMDTTAAQAEQSANQARSAVAAYQAAFLATVPPPVIAANRALLMSLVATNIVGQNTPAIAATEAQYAQMWAQDATAMYGYADTSAAATTLTSFAPPSPNTNPGGVGNQAAAVDQATGTGGLAQLVSAVPQTLQQLASSVTSGGPAQLLLNLVNSAPVKGLQADEAALAPFFSLSQVISAGVNAGGVDVAPSAEAAEAGGLAAADHVAAVSAGAPAAAHVAAVSGGAPAATLADSYRSGVGGAGVSAGLGRAASVGGLSVPQSWATASPAVRLAATALPADGLGAWAGSAAPGSMFTGAPGGMFNGMCPVGSVVNTSRNGESRSRADSGLKVIPQMPGEPGVGQNTPSRWAKPDQHAPHDASASNERDELNDLRTAIAALAKQRDVLERSANLFIEKAKKAMQR
jgi:PPE-repeat protein